MALVWFFVNAISVSLILALFEIVIEKDKGWATVFNKKFWGKKCFEGNIVSKIAEKHYLTVYHIFMFAIVIPAVLALEYAFVRTMPLLFIASWFAIAVVEDFLWFALNWHYPNSLKDLLSGNIWWHTHYWRIGSLRLPRSYFVSMIWIAILLSIQVYFL